MLKKTLYGDGHRRSWRDATLEGMGGRNGGREVIVFYTFN